MPLRPLNSRSQTKAHLVYLQHHQPKATTVAVTFDPSAVYSYLPFSHWSCLLLTQMFLHDASEMSQLHSRDTRASTSPGARPLASPCKTQQPHLPVSPSDSCRVLFGFFFTNRPLLSLHPQRATNRRLRYVLIKLAV